jgi:magnesium chelatase subunit H
MYDRMPLKLRRFLSPTSVTLLLLSDLLLFKQDVIGWNLVHHPRGWGQHSMIDLHRGPFHFRNNDRGIYHPSSKVLLNVASSAVDESIIAPPSTSSSSSSSIPRYSNDNNTNSNKGIPTIVLVAGFESFNRQLYLDAASSLMSNNNNDNSEQQQLPLYDVNLQVFADTEIRIPTTGKPNPIFVQAVLDADIFIGSLIFDYDDVQVLIDVLRQGHRQHQQLDQTDINKKKKNKKPRFIFECATELMAYNQVGTFSMMPPLPITQDDGTTITIASTSTSQSTPPPVPPGPPPAVKAILKRFSSGKEEDKLSGYLELLKFGPDLLKYVPGEKASDLRTWLEVYRYWNQSGLINARSMIQLLLERCIDDDDSTFPVHPSIKDNPLPPVVITPGIGLLHPLRVDYYWTSPREYLDWRLATAKVQNDTGLLQAPRVALLLYRKHVISKLRYIDDLIRQMESLGVLPIPIFINGVEAHTIVRDLLTSTNKENLVRAGTIQRESTYQRNKAVAVDAIVNSIGFPLVGGPAGSMEAGRNVDIAQQLLREMNVPYMIASPLLLQSITQWKQSGVLGLQSVVLYSLPELDGAIDTVVLGGLVGDKVALVPERVRKLTGRLHGWTTLRRTPPKDRTVSIVLYGFPPNVGAVGTAALLNVPQSLENLLKRLRKEGYDVGTFGADPAGCGQSLVAALAVLSENSAISSGANRMVEVLEKRMDRARQGDTTTAECLSRDGGGLGGALVRAKDVTADELERMLGRYMFGKVRRAWSEKDRGPGVSSEGKYVVAGLQLGNVFITIQPLLGVEGDPMRLLFERDLTPHPQYCAAYAYMKDHSHAIVHLGMHGTSEWLPGQVGSELNASSEYRTQQSFSSSQTRTYSVFCNHANLSRCFASASWE